MISPFNTTLNHIISQSERPLGKGTARGKLFESLIRQYFEIDAIYSCDIKKIWSWDNWPHRRHSDRGVDLVVQTKDDEYWAIQCKCYSVGSKINKPGIDSFISEAGIEFETDTGRKSFARRFLVMTGEMTKQASETVRDQNPLITVLDADSFDQALIDWSSFIESNSLRAKKPNSLRPHQTEAIDAVVDKFQTADRGQLIMACGTGKTFTSLRLAEQLHGTGGRVLFLAPSISLVSQAMREWTAQSAFVQPFVVCSDVNVGKGKDGKIKGVQSNEDMLVSDMSLPPTTDAKKLAAGFATPRPGQLKVIFSTYHSIDVIHQAQSKHGMPAFDLVVCDEAHRMAGVSMLDTSAAKVDETTTSTKVPGDIGMSEAAKVASGQATVNDATGAKAETAALAKGAEESFFVRIHQSEYIQAKKRLYMTATPRIYNEVTKTKAKARKDDAVLYSMDDTALFGEEFHRLLFSKAIDKKLLSDYKVIIVALDEDQMELVADQCSGRAKSALIEDQGEKIIDDEKIESAEKTGKNPASALTTQTVAEILGTWKALSGIDVFNILGSGAQVEQTGDDAVKPMRSAVAFSNTIKESERICMSFDLIQNHFENNLPKDLERFVKVETSHIDGRMNDKDRRAKLQWLKDISGSDVGSDANAAANESGADAGGASAGASSIAGAGAGTGKGAGPGAGESSIAGAGIDAGDKKHGCKILSNARCLSEGVDVPSLDAVVFFKERKSIVDVVQAVGRVMRKAPGKEYGHIILPVCIPSGKVSDYENFISNNKVFARIWGVVKALRAHDDRFVSVAFFRDRVKIVPGPSITPPPPADRW
ncbi:MAG: DEAD/DEAH box helicase family protein [Gammaproteobacteria bacterium]|nr:DEAD/DEAH box helicase family protein [Gammaproteobacteria bacterium]